MLKKFYLITTATLISSTLTAHAADDRGGRVIPLASSAPFGYTQIIGDRLCLFDTECRKIAEYSAYSKVENHNIYTVDDDSNVYFFGSGGLFLTISSGTEYVCSFHYDCVTVRTNDGYTAYFPDGRSVSLSAQDAESAARERGYDSFSISYNDGFLISGGAHSWSSIDSDSNSDSLYEKLWNRRYYLGKRLDDGRYIISHAVRGGAYEYGICDAEGNVVISPQFSVLVQLSNGMWDICSSHDHDNYKYAIEKQVTSNPRFIYDDVATDFGDGLIGVIITVDGNTKKLYLNEELEPVLDLTDKEFSLGTFKDGRAVVHSYSIGDAVINTDGEIIMRGYDFMRYYISTNGSLLYASLYQNSVSPVVIYLPRESEPIKEHTIPWDNGSPKSTYYTTDIKVTIDGEPIQSAALDGQTLICLNDLENHGFKTSFTYDSRRFIADKASSKTNTASQVTTYTSVGEPLGYSVTTDISAYVNGKYIEAEAIDGKLWAKAEELCAPPSFDDPDYYMLRYLGTSPYLMRCEYDNSTRTLAMYTFENDN